MSTTTAPLPSVADRPGPTAGITLLAVGPVCAICGVPLLWPLMAALGIGASAFVAHTVSWFLVPVVVLLLARNARRHGDHRPFRLAAAGAVVYLAHTGLHFVDGMLAEVLFVLTDNVAVVLLGIGAMWDLAITRRARRAQDRRASMVRQQELGVGECR